jgi:hypothetical protein
MDAKEKYKIISDGKDFSNPYDIRRVLMYACKKLDLEQLKVIAKEGLDKEDIKILSRHFKEYGFTPEQVSLYAHNYNNKGTLEMCAYHLDKIKDNLKPADMKTISILTPHSVSWILERLYKGGITVSQLYGIISFKGTYGDYQLKIGAKKTERIKHFMDFIEDIKLLNEYEEKIKYEFENKNYEFFKNLLKKIEKTRNG